MAVEMLATADLMLEGWAIAGIVGVVAIVGSVVAVLRFADGRYLTRSEAPRVCAQPCDVLRREYMARGEIERELRHRADRTHELASTVQTFVNKVQKMEHEQTVQGVVLRAIAKQLGVSVPGEAAE